jgi:hypothetical protein
VVDERGRAIVGAAVVAVGAITAHVETDRRGSFSLALPSGDYQVHASQAGYVSPAGQPVRLSTVAPIDRRITLRRALASTTATSASLPSTTTTSPPAAAPEDSADSHTEIAWRLRHLPRTVLRDVRRALWAEPPAAAFPRATDGAHVTF